MSCHVHNKSLRFPLLRLGWLFSLHLVLSSLSCQAYDNGLGLTPPMGWNSWNKFACDIQEDLIKDIANAMIDLGLKDVGYEYVNLDDCWQISRNSSGYVQEDPDAFPSGIRALRDYIHSLGLKFGLYSDAGIWTCQRRPGSLGYERKDAAIYKEWKIDYLKYDNCYSTGLNVTRRYQAMHDALNATGYPIFFSMCEWGIKNPATWAPAIGNSWRTTGDISATWKSITTLLDKNDQWHGYAGPGGWNDPDMLEVGNGKLTIAEQRSHFTLWCLIKAPLLLGNDLLSMEASTLEIVTNAEVIALNQDPLGVQGYKRSATTEGLEVWAGPLSGGDVAVVLLNRSSNSSAITATWEEIGIQSSSTVMKTRDLWEHQDVGTQAGYVTAVVDSHDVVAYRLQPAGRKYDKTIREDEKKIQRIRTVGGGILKSG